MSNFMRESNVSDMDPTPMVTMASYDAKETRAAETVRVTRLRQRGLADLKDKIDLLRPQGDLLSLEVEKLNKVLEDQRLEGTGMKDEARDMSGVVALLRTEIEGDFTT